jgi:hypothetical protein
MSRVDKSIGTESRLETERRNLKDRKQTAKSLGRGKGELQLKGTRFLLGVWKCSVIR